MKRALIAILCIGILLCGCNDKNTEANQDSRPVIVATLFPQYDFCRQIVGDDFQVKLLLPPGTESHNFEPSVADIKAVNGAALFVYTGNAMEPWAASITKELKNVIDVSKNIELEEHEHFGEDHDEHFGEKDPHIWTSPALAEKMVENILQGLIEKFPENAEKYTNNANEYCKKLDALDREFFDICEGHQGEVLCHGGRFSLTYFAERYGLNFIAAFDSCDSQAEPSTARVQQLIETINNQKIKTVFYEELTEPKIAKTISDETGAKMLLMHSCHNVSKAELEAGVTYLSLMEQNAQNIKIAFGEE